MNLAPIQQQIVSKLKNASTLRHSELHPGKDIASDLYNYHLKALISKGLVKKETNGYSLSSSGERYVADIWHTSDESQRLFKINVITIVSRYENSKLEILNQRRTSQPSYGIIGVPGGTIIKGEPALEGATRKLQQETGLIGNFKLVGIERRFYYKSNSLFSDVLFPICYCYRSEGELQTTTEFGDNFWVSIDDAIKNDSREDDQVESIVSFLKNLKKGSKQPLEPFYREKTIAI